MKQIKKFSILLLSLACIMPLTSCSNNSSAAKSSAVTNTAAADSASPASSSDPEPSASQEDNAQKSTSPSPSAAARENIGNNLEAGLGDLKLNYNNKWTYDEDQSENASLAFTRGNALIGVTCSEESSYQCPEDMIQTSINMMTDTEGYKLVEDMKTIQVNGEKWCQIKYETGTGDEKQMNVQRCYGKNYYSYTITYSALESDFEKYESNAIAILNSCKMNVPDNEEGEAAAKKELVGELDAGDKGYLVLNEDGTYYWYMDSSKSMDYVHYGTYGCDDKIDSLNITEGHGYYLCLFPEKYFVDGEETDMGTYKIEFAISTSSSSGVDCDYSAMNLTNSDIYYFDRVK